MKKFLLVVAGFALPVLLVLGLFGWVCRASGEHVGVDEVAPRMAAGEALLYGTAYRYNSSYLKYAVASELGAEFLVLGSSRCMQFRREFFTVDSFYNAGGATSYSNEYLYFLQQLPEDKRPSVLILQFDQYHYHPHWANMNPAEDRLGYIEVQPNYIGDLNQSMKDWAQGKYSVVQTLSAPKEQIGLAAASRHSGFRSDGTYDYGVSNDPAHPAIDPGFSATLRSVSMGSDRFVWADELSTNALEDTRRLLAWCSENGVTAVGVLPPYAPTVLEKMRSSGNYGYMDKLPAALSALCAQYGYEFYDFTEVAGADDVEYLDGYHGSDRVYARMALQMAQQSEALAPYLDAAALADMLETQPGVRGFEF